MFISRNDKYIVPIEEIDFWEVDIFEKNTRDQIEDEKLEKIQGNMNNNMSNSCYENKTKAAIDMINIAIENVQKKRAEKVNAIWLEASGCFGQFISLLNSENPNLIYMLEKFVDMKYFGSIQGNEGEAAYKNIVENLDKEYIFIVSGAIPIKDDGLYATIATYKGRKITAKEAVSVISKNAKYIINVGTCACFGGPTAARPNLSGAVSVSEFLNRNDIIKIPGCPANPVWVAGILGYITSEGMPELDSNGRPLAYYSTLIHDICPRRKFFDKGIFAEKFGDSECMFKLGCKGPVTYAYCPVSRWNGTYNWPIEDNTTCIGCAAPGFPDAYEPFVKYDSDNI